MFLTMNKYNKPYYNKFIIIYKLVFYNQTLNKNGRFQLNTF